MGFHEALRTIALRDVLKQTPEYYYRWVCRWYSRTFHVPLPQVEALDEEHVFQHFYECQYETMTSNDDLAEDLEKERQELLETEEERVQRSARDKQQAVDDVVWAEQMRKKTEEDKRRAEVKRQKQLADVMDKEASEAAPLKMPKQVYRPIAEPEMVGPKPSEPRQPNLPAAPMVLPGIKMRFIPEEEMERLLEEPSDGGNLDEEPPKKI